MEEKLSTSLNRNDETGIKIGGQNDLSEERNCLPYCQDMNPLEVKDGCAEGLINKNNEGAMPTFATSLCGISRDKECSVTTNFEQKRVSRRDEHEHALNFCGQFGDGLAQDKNCKDSVSSPAQTKVSCYF